MKKHNKYDKKTTQGHALFLYSTSEERLGLIAEYFRQGLVNNELCVFVTPEPQDEVIKNFKKVGLDINQAVKDNSFRIFAMNQTYLPNGHFAADYMLNNVHNFIDEAHAQNYSGLRTAGEMSWLAEHSEFTDAATTYEQNVNSLNVPEPNFTGLCLYPMGEGFTDTLKAAVHTHPSVIYKGKVMPNSHYQPS